MEIRLVRGSEVAAVAADWIARALHGAGRPAPTLMAALGSSALPAYAELAGARVRGDVDTSRLRLIQLDEYQPIHPADPRSLIGWLRRDVAAPLGVPDSRIIALDGSADDPAEACRTYDLAVDAAGGVDVAVLGLGPNGHLGFNEPPSNADAPTRRVELSAVSLASNARYWPGREVPPAALTAGMTTILGARRILLIVTGAAKRTILLETLTGTIGPDLPASHLRTHPNVTLVADAEAWPWNDPIS